jgi:hypothetical protein
MYSGSNENDALLIVMYPKGSREHMRKDKRDREGHEGGDTRYHPLDEIHTDETMSNYYDNGEKQKNVYD